MCTGPRFGLPMERRSCSMGYAAGAKQAGRVVDRPNGGRTSHGRPTFQALSKTTCRRTPCARGFGTLTAANGSSTLPLAAKAGSFGASESLREGAIDQNPELVASGNGRLRPGGSASEDGKLAYNIWSSSESIYQVSDQRPRPETGFHHPVTSNRGWSSQLPLRLSRRKVDGLRHLQRPASPTPSC